MTKEEKYIIDEAKWIKENNIRIGTKVKVTRKVKTGTRGWCNSWESPEMPVGVVLKVDGLHNTGSGINLYNSDDKTSYGFPFFVLEPIKRKKK